MLIVKTAGAFMLCALDGFTPDINSGVATLVPESAFVLSRIKIGQLVVLAKDVPNTLTQDGVEGYLNPVEPKDATPAEPKGKPSRKVSASKGD